MGPRIFFVEEGFGGAELPSFLFLVRSANRRPTRPLSLAYSLRPNTFVPA